MSKGAPVLVGLGLVLVLAGCSSGPDPTGGVPLTPWDGTVPAQLQPATVAPAPLCRAAQLAVVGGGFQFTPAVSGGTGEVRVRNAGQSACRLTGRPEVQIVGAVPAPEQRQIPLPAQPPTFPTVVPPDSALLAVPPGGAAILGVDWRNWCVPRTAKTPVPPRAIRLTLPDGAGSIDVGYNAVPPCDAPGSATTVGVHPFQPTPLPATTPWTTSVVQATIEPLSGGKGDLAGERGEVVRFVVRISNPSATPISFEHCPLVVEMLAPAGQPEVYQLNCRAAGQLPAGGSLRFEMRIQIPMDAPAGNNGLFWELDPTGSHGPEAVSRIVVGV
ncbi:MAG TPA: DUF4232 domain-containing protein [Micromonosporaceae bacterium]|nr:DUF4232 domain-containing protein [Micromonosporaceae bacterium]